MHTHRNVPGLPALRSQLERVIRGLETLPRDLKVAILQVLHKLPDGDRLCHGDFHPYNVLMTPKDRSSSIGRMPVSAIP